MSEKVKCQNEGCSAMILPITAEETGGVCMPCKQKADRIAHEKYVRENRKDVDLYEGVSAPIEILKIMHQKREHDPLINYLPCKYSVVELYEGLNREDISQLIEYVLENIDVSSDIVDKQNETEYDIAKEIAAFTNADLTKIHYKLIEMEVYYPDFLFRGASSEIAQILISRVSTNPNHILSALSFIRTKNVISKFTEWRKNPPAWKDQLYIPPERYAHSAGWELDKKSGVRDLILNKCYPLVTKSSSHDNDPIKTCTETDSNCRWCEKPLTNLFEFDLAEAQLSFVPFPKKRLIITTCEICSAYGNQLYMKIEENGKSTWHKKMCDQDICQTSMNMRGCPLTS